MGFALATFCVPFQPSSEACAFEDLQTGSISSITLEFANSTSHLSLCNLQREKKSSTKANFFS